MYKFIAQSSWKVPDVGKLRVRTFQRKLDQATTVTVIEPHDAQFQVGMFGNIISTNLSSPSLLTTKRHGPQKSERELIQQTEAARRRKRRLSTGSSRFSSSRLGKEDSH